jgi:murein DD-endopeptidase MepM/ murein hydrolase activator NlpD
MYKQELKRKIIKQDAVIVKVNNHIDSLYKILDGLPLGSPLDSTVIDGGFGIRKHPILRIWRRHKGIDLKGTYRDTIYATGKGNVKRAKWSRSYGRIVVIEHSAGYESTYAHMNKVFVKKGQKIKRGDAIGTIGSSGLASGTHLHYEVSRHGIKEDPQIYINNNNEK